MEGARASNPGDGVQSPAQGREEGPPSDFAERFAAPPEQEHERGQQPPETSATQSPSAATSSDARQADTAGTGPRVIRIPSPSRLFVDAVTPIKASNPRCFLDVDVSGEPIGRLVVELRADVVPKTAENFRTLCAGTLGYGYRGCSFHRIVPNFICQSGCFETPSGKTGGCSIYEGRPFEDENFALLHREPGLLSMANAGPDKNGSQFFITMVKAPYLDKRHVVFGRVLTGMQVLKMLSDLGTVSGTPLRPVSIRACGVL
ncbi:unnamed protein product [Ixodes pacificus]